MRAVFGHVICPYEEMSNVLGNQNIILYRVSGELMLKLQIYEYNQAQLV